MIDYIQQGIDKKLISFNEDRSRITYLHQGKERNYNNPEEKVQCLTFLKLILEYGYPVNHIKQFVPVLGRNIHYKDSSSSIGKTARDSRPYHSTPSPSYATSARRQRGFGKSEARSRTDDFRKVSNE